MKQRNTATTEFFGHSFAILAVSIFVLWLLSSAGNFSQAAAECACGNCTSITAAVRVSIPLTGIRSSSFSLQKNHIQYSSRRLTSISQTPFVLSTAPVGGCCTEKSVFITPALHPATSPATFVRAGPYTI